MWAADNGTWHVCTVCESSISHPREVDRSVVEAGEWYHERCFEEQ